MTLSEELAWRGFKHQSTLSSPKHLDQRKYTFYWGVDPSSDSMTVGNLATAMMIKLFIKYGHKPVLLVGGATGMIGDPDGKSTERSLLSLNDIKHNKQAITKQYQNLFKGSRFKIVDNFDWFKDFNYLSFLREIGKHVPMRQMLAREFVQTRLSKDGSGISYAEFSYVLIQAYDFYYLNQNYGVDLQLCGSDQWGNSVAGVDLIRRLSGSSTDVWSAPLIVNQQTGQKFGKTEDGAVWLDANKTSPSAFYQFWVNVDDSVVEDYLKIFTELSKEEIEKVITEQKNSPKTRPAQFKLADSVTSLVHGSRATELARTTTSYITGQKSLGEVTKTEINHLASEVPLVRVKRGSEITAALVSCSLASSNTQARKLLEDGAIYINQERVSGSVFSSNNYPYHYLLIRRGKAYKDSAIVELTD